MLRRAMVVLHRPPPGMDGGFSAGKRVGDVDMDSILGSGGMSTESKGERVAREQLERQEKQAALHVEKQARWVEKRRREAVAITLKQGIVGRGLAGKYSANTAEKTKAALSSSSQNDVENRREQVERVTQRREAEGKKLSQAQSKFAKKKPTDDELDF